MRRGLLATLALVGCARTSASGLVDDAAVTAPPPPGAASFADPRSAAGRRPGVRVVVAPDDTDALSLVRTKRLEARAEGRVLVVYAGAAWCEPCKRFRAEVTAGRLDERLGAVTLLAFDADRDADRLASAGYGFRSIPYVALPGADGRPTDAAEASEKGEGAWRGLLGRLEAWQRLTP